ncbi:MAG TPA: hypothetical protein PLR60_02490 [Syntrophorhabdaceae bacterium]|nr:hypothetical protein [Syntrophorhabdaceae bacterium]
MKSKGVVLGALIVILAALCVAGCGREETKTFSTPDGKVTVTAKPGGPGEGVVKIEGKEGSVTVKTGPQAVSEAELGAPVYPGAQVVSSGQFSESKKGAASGLAAAYMMTTNDSFDKVVSFYKSNLKDVQQSMDQTSSDQKMAMFMTGKKGDMRNIQITAKASGGPTNIHIMKIVEK